jgi:hypothetical protein
MGTLDNANNAANMSGLPVMSSTYRESANRSKDEPITVTICPANISRKFFGDGVLLLIVFSNIFVHSPKYLPQHIH